MDETFTIQSIMPTGKTDKFGNAGYYVKFVESENTFTLLFKDPRKEGDKLEGHIDGSKFIKKPFVQGQAVSGAPVKKTYGAIQADRGDGMRQGMCINNAAQYVSDHSGGKIDLPDVWANTVHTYATALYNLGDLGSTPAPEEQVSL
jgi:hypothetical protein